MFLVEYSVRGRSSGERGEVIRVWAKLSKGAIVDTGMRPDPSEAEIARKTRT